MLLLDFCLLNLLVCMLFLFIFFKISFIYFCERKREGGSEHGLGGGAEGEANS